jgi:hypothetical protein
MHYIWNDNYPIAIHITKLDGDITPSTLQAVANHEQLVVRDLRNGDHVESVDYHPENA